MAFNDVQFETLELKARAITRVLLQFRRSPLFLHLLQALVHSVQDAANVSHDVLRLRTPLHARNHCLDVLGRIVGQMRELVNFNQYPWFTPDVAFRGADYAPAWVPNAPLGDSFIADDATYRGLIEGKVFRNHVRYGSVPELKEVLSLAFGEQISFIRVGPMLVRVVVSATASDNLIGYIMQRGNTAVADDVFFLPFPATMQISQVVRNTAYEFENSLYEWGLATFTRASTAYHPDTGELVASGEPRYREGGGIFVEEGTTNIIQGDPLKFIGWTSFSGASVTLTQNQAIPEIGATDATRIQTSGGTSDIKYFRNIASPSVNGTPYFYQVWVKNIGTNPVGVGNNQAAKQLVQPGELRLVTLVFNGDGTSTANFRFETRTTHVNDSLDFIVWRPQVETKPYATTFTDSTRAAELCTVPTAGVISLDEGTVEVDCIGQENAVDNAMVVGHTTGGGRNRLYILKTNNKWAFWIGSTPNQITDVAVEMGKKYRLSLAWNSGVARGVVDGVKVAEWVYTGFAALDTVIGIGRLSQGGFLSNTFIGPIRFSSRARTDEELANTGPLVADAGTTALLTFNNHLKILSPYQGG